MSKPKVLISDKMDPNAARIFEERGCDVDAVSYTHLTLPTILLV